MKNKNTIAVLFDMDGCLVDTEPVINRAAILGLKEWGINAQPDDFIPFIGRGEVKYIGGVAEKYGVPYESKMKDRVYDIYLNIVGAMLRPHRGALECLENLKRDGIPLALASSADRIKIEANLRVAKISLNTFDVILGAEDVEHKKPDPAVYLKAAEKLNIEPKNCIVVEDAINGIQAAHRAKMRCIAVTTTFKKRELETEKPEFFANDLFAVYDIIVNALKKNPQR